METNRPIVEAAEEILGKYFPVLDHGFVCLKDYMGSDQCLEEAARTSYAYGTRKVGETWDLIRSLMRRGHSSPFEQVEFKFHMAMPIFVARQIIRVRTASVNEMSGRYSLMPMLFYTPSVEQVQSQSKTDKQGRSGLQAQSTPTFLGRLDTHRGEVVSDYHWATDNDISRELARIDLPLSTYTQWYWKIDGNNLLKTLSLRCDAHAQWETRQYFNVIAGIAKRVIPLAFEAWQDYCFHGCKMSYAEMQAIREAVYPNEDEDKIEIRRGPSILREEIGGMSKTEWRELLLKLKKPERVSFDLDLSSAKDPEFFEQKYRLSAEG